MFFNLRPYARDRGKIASHAQQTRPWGNEHMREKPVYYVVAAAYPRANNHERISIG
jgi:hypothetical protein